MDKSSRIKAFVDVQVKNNVVTVKKCSNLFEKLLINVRNEYKKFREDREPKINNLEISTGSQLNETEHWKDNKFIEALNRFKENQELPFSITQEIKAENQSNLFPDVVFPNQHIIKISYFVSNSFSKETFHQIQRHHKIWWMKYGTNPGKYSISDQKSDSFSKFVTIRSNVGDSVMDVERLKFFSLKDCITEKDILSQYMCRVPNKKKETIPDVIETVVDLQVASLALLVDAVNLSDDYTAFHRRSAPFQLALVVKEATEDLIDLASFIELLVKETDSKIAILNESKIKIESQDDLMNQFQKFDNIGIPYSIIIDQTSLESGMFKLRNRNTTLSETIHLSDVNNYLIKIFNSAWKFNEPSLKNFSIRK